MLLKLKNVPSVLSLIRITESVLGKVVSYEIGAGLQLIEGQ